MIDPDEYWVEPESEDLVSKAAALLDAGKIKALPPAWALDLPLTEKGGIPRTIASLTYCLERHPMLAGVVAYDERSDVLRAVRAVPWAQPGEITDAWLTEFRVWCEQTLRVSWSVEQAHQATDAVGRRHAYDPIRRYLDGLRWDGVERLSRMLIDYAEASDEPVIEAMTRCWMISAVRRVLEPGCQADHALVLEGAQGGGKTSFFRLLAGDGYHLEGLPSLDHKDAAQALQGPWIVELGELAALSKHDAETIKQFVSGRIDRYRPAYGRLMRSVPRRMVFCGTTNQDQYLRDGTGNRRWWPALVGSIDLAAIAEVRDQLWAEAVAAATAGEPHWLRGGLLKDAIIAQGERQVADPWEDAIVAYIESESVQGGPLVRVSSSDLWDVVQTGVGDQQVRDWQRIHAIMRRLGWAAHRWGPVRGFARKG